MGALFSGDSVSLRGSDAAIRIVTKSEECLEGAGLKEEKRRQECRRYQGWESRAGVELEGSPIEGFLKDGIGIGRMEERELGGAQGSGRIFAVA